ncbi:unnamed protein product [Protopolystoma xenopodis]|uniref:Uncharacterized protein n=1 Tax=Protopolystoma xenopodis TaxID=117903 RepID=A0A3S5BUP3_9PLAT|nr:unnamed protein product [Protopolystoma xenopodis]
MAQVVRTGELWPTSRCDSTRLQCAVEPAYRSLIGTRSNTRADKCPRLASSRLRVAALPYSPFPHALPSQVSPSLLLSA